MISSGVDAMGTITAAVSEDLGATLPVHSRVKAGSKRRWLLVLLFVAAALLLAACAGDDPTNLGRVVDGDLPQNSLNPAGPTADKIDSLFWLVFWIATGVFVLVTAALVFAIVRFRHRPGKDRQIKQLHGNTRLEIAWTIAPALLLAFVAVPTLSTLFEVRADPDPADNALEIEVIGHQWWWEFRYPGYGFTTANEMHIPEDRVIHLNLTSADVIHSFWVPRLSGKRDAVPGRISNITFQASEPGWYVGQCAEFCGLAHADMRQRVLVQSASEFEAWATAQATPAVVPEGDTAEARAWETFSTVCAACHAVNGTDATAQFAPNLTHFASRTSFAGATIDNTVDHLRQWLDDPSSLKPMRPELNDPANGRILGMPDFGLTDEQIQDLIALLNYLE
jgi:cytochrome c oxidase subunit 2